MKRSELTAILAYLSGCTALSIDTVLPAFPAIRRSFSMPPTTTSVSAVVSVFLIGLAVGQLVWGFAGDRWGRRTVIFCGYGLFALGAALCTIGTSFTMVLCGRALWGLGAGSPRAMAQTVARDSYSGAELARVMSHVQAAFMLAPVIGPVVGVALLKVVPWRGVFGFGVVVAVVGAAWTLRLPETAPSHSRGSRTSVRAAALAVFRQREAMWFTAALTLHTAAFVPYLGSAELIFGRLYGHRATFALWFGGAAALMGAAAALAGRAVKVHGPSTVGRGALVGYVAACLALATAAATGAGRPPFVLYYALLAAVLFFHLPLSPLYSASAMHPLGAVAGAGSALIGTISLGVGTVISGPVTDAIHNSVTPLAVGFLVLGGLGGMCALRGWSYPDADRAAGVRSPP